MSLFKTGQSGNPAGRPRNARNKISTAFLEALAADFVEHGAAAIRLLRIEKPAEYCKVVASIIPREIEFHDNRLAELSDDELDRVIEYARSLVSAARNAASREEQTIN